LPQVEHIASLTRESKTSSSPIDSHPLCNGLISQSRNSTSTRGTVACCRRVHLRMYDPSFQTSGAAKRQKDARTKGKEISGYDTTKCYTVETVERRQRESDPQGGRGRGCTRGELARWSRW